MKSENPYTPPRSDVGTATDPRFKRHYKVEGDLLRVREGAMLPDVCLYSGKEGECLKRSTRRLLWHPAWVNRILILILITAFALKRPGITFVCLIILVMFFMFLRKSTIIHHAYSRASFFLRKLGACFAILLVPFAVRLTDNWGDSNPLLHFVIVVLVIYLAFAIVRRVGGFRVKRIDLGCVTLGGVHPIALKTLKELKEEPSPEGPAGSNRKA
jgi:hypothetical protein